MRIFGKDDRELDDGDIEELKQTVLQAEMPERVEKIALKELEKLAKTNPSSAEYTIGTNYIDYLVSLPWHKSTEDNLDIQRAAAILDEEHYGLKDVKDRILEFLAIRTLRLSASCPSSRRSPPRESSHR